MRCRVISLMIAVFISAAANITYANELTIALKGGVPIIDDDIAGLNTDLDTEAAFGLTLGYELNSNATVELEFARGTAEITETNGTQVPAIDVEVDSIGLFYTQRTRGDLYFVFRSGIVREEISFTSASTPDTSADEVLFSWGLGGGYRINEDFSVEADYTQIEADVALFLVSARYAYSL